MYDLQTKRNLLKVTGTIRRILESEGYPLNGMKNKDAVSIYARVKFGEEIPPIKAMCDEWLFKRMTLTDINNPPVVLSRKGIDSSYRKAVRQIKYYFKDHNIPIVGLDQKQLVRAYAKHRYNESAYEFKEWVIEKISSNSFKNMPEQFTVKNAKKIRAVKRAIKPTKPNNKDYRAFLKSKYWLEVREMVVHRDKRECTKCKRSDKIQVHHLTYKNHFNEHKHLEDLITLCSDCHKKIHQGLI